MFNIDIKKIKQILAIIFLVIAVVFLYSWKENIFNNNQNLTESEQQSYSDFVSRNPIVESGKDLDGNGRPEWQDLLDKNLGVEIVFEDNKEDPRDYNTNLTDLIVADMAVASSYIKSGQADDSLYESIMDNLILRSRYVVEDLKVIVKNKYTQEEERTFLTGVDSFYAYAIYNLTSTSTAEMIEKDILSSEEKTYLQDIVKNLKQSCDMLNNKNTFILSKYTDDYKKLIQICHDAEYVAYSILNKEKDPARAMAGISVLTNMISRIYTNISDIKNIAPLSILSNNDFFLLKN